MEKSGVFFAKKPDKGLSFFRICGKIILHDYVQAIIIVLLRSQK